MHLPRVELGAAALLCRRSKSSGLNAVVLAQKGQSNQLALLVVPFSALSVNKAVFMPMLQFLPILEQVRSWPIVVA